MAPNLYHTDMIDRNNKRSGARQEQPGALLFGVDKVTHDIRVAQLHDGRLLMELVRAVVLMRDGAQAALDFAVREQTLIFREPSGSHGEIDLDGDNALGLFYSPASTRDPARHNGRSYFTPLTHNIPKPLRYPMERLAISFKQGTDDTPWITTAVWSERGQLVTPGSWDSFLEHGGWIIERLFMEAKPALRGYQRRYSLSDAHLAFVESLHARKLARPKEWLLLSQEDVEALVSSGHSGLQASSDALVALHIHQPYRPS